MESLGQAQDLTGQARARAMIYRALAEALAWPVAGVSDLLLDAARTGAQALDSAACRRAVLTLAELPLPDREGLRRCYTRSISSPDRRPVALYESLHRQGCLAGPITWEVEKRYQALGLALECGELPDHASVELAFLGHLAAAEAEARAAGNGWLVTRLRAEQRHFLRIHAGTWLPDMGGALAATDDPFYAVVGGLLREFLAEELAARKQGSQARARLPALKEPGVCTLCGVCVGSCPLGALQVVESVSHTVLSLDPSQCVGCARCVRICPQGTLALKGKRDSLPGAASGGGRRALRRSPRATCPNCGRPTVSYAELDAVFARLQADPATQQRLSLCIGCKSWSV